jgi:hypothetical protein
MLDIFRDDAFSVTSLTDAIEKLPFVPGRLGQLGIFSPTSVATTTVVLEEREGLLDLIAPTPRGGPGETIDVAKRVARALVIPKFEINDAIMAEEVQGVRAFGSQSQVEMLQNKVGERLVNHLQRHAVTEEYARIGAIKGIVTYKGGSTLNLYTTFDVSAQTEVDFSFDTAADGELRETCANVVRTISDELGGTPVSGFRAVCGRQFFNDLIKNGEVRDTYLGWVQAEELRKGYAFGGFEFGGITWEEYRGNIGGTSFVHTDKCHIFPEGVPNLFRTYYGPADYIETVNTPGLSRYAKQYEMPSGKGIHLDSQMNTLNICTRPRALVQGRRT